MALTVALWSSAAAFGADLVVTLPLAKPEDAPTAVVYLDEVRGKPVLRSAPVKISLKDFKFTPPLIVLVQGEAIDFRNDDITYHTVMSVSPAKTFELQYAAQENPVVRFDQPGEVKLVCTLHDKMRSTVLILKNGYYAQPDASGKAVLRNVPKGTYVVKLYRVNVPEQSVTVKVPAKAKESVAVSF